MRKGSMKKLPALFLCMLLTLSFAPGTELSVKATEQEEPKACTVTEGCTLEEGHEGECVIPDEKTEEPTAQERLEEMIAALPAPESIDPENEEQVKEISDQITKIMSFAEENGIDVEEHERLNAVIAALYPVETLAAGATFLADGIRYQVTGENTVSVISDTDETAEFIPEEDRIGKGQATYKGEITIPATVTDNSGVTYTVTAIEGLSFYWTEVTKVTLPDTITKINGLAFYNCKNLTEVDLKEGLLEIGSSAFEGCGKLETLEIPSTVTTLGSAAFGGCSSLKSLHIPAGVTENLVKALVGNSLYPYLENVTIAEGSPYEIEGGVLYKGTEAQLYMRSEENVVVRKGTTKLADDCFSLYSGIQGVFSQNYALKSVTLPDTITEIPDYAFYQCINLTSATLPDGLTKIGDRAFYDTDLTSLTLPAAVETLGEAAFQGCEELETVVLPDGLKELGEDVFTDCCSLETIHIPSGVATVTDYAFMGCTSLKEIVLSEGVTTIGTAAFGYCENIEMIVIPSSVTKIKDYAFVDGLSDGATLIMLGATPPVFGNEIFSEEGENPENIMIVVPTGAEAAYAGIGALKTYMTDADGNVIQNQDYSLTLPDSIIVCPGKSASFSEKMEVPEKAALSITSSDTAVAAANADGTVSGVSEGTARITAVITLDGVVLASDECVVTVQHRDGTEWKSDAANHWHECTVCGERTDMEVHSFTWVIDKEATEKEAGARHEECTACGYKKASVEIPVTGGKGDTDDKSPEDTKKPDKGNDTQNTGKSETVKTAEQKTTVQSSSLSTGDNSRIMLWSVLLLAAFGGLAGMVFHIRKRRGC